MNALATVGQFGGRRGERHDDVVAVLEHGHVRRRALAGRHVHARDRLGLEGDAHARLHAVEHRRVGGGAQHPGREADHEHVPDGLPSCVTVRPPTPDQAAERARTLGELLPEGRLERRVERRQRVRGGDLEPDRRIGLGRRTGGRRRRARRRCGGRGHGGRRARCPVGTAVALGATDAAGEQAAMASPSRMTASPRGTRDPKAGVVGVTWRTPRPASRGSP